jgi:GNAT superfamily N-acetyltransferase
MTETYANYLKEFAKMVGDRQNNEVPTEYEYLATIRPISEAYPKENLIRLEEGGHNGYGTAIYSKPLSLKQIEHFSFFPATEIKMVGTKIYYYENYVADVKTDINSIYLSKYIRNGDIELEIISPIKFLEKIQSGEYRPINEMAEGGEITMNMPLLIRVLELAKEDVKEDKEIHFIAERLQSIADKGTLTMEDYDYISGLESNEKIQKLIAENDSNDSDLRFEQGGEIEDLISRGIVDLKMYDTTPKHAKEYGFQCLNPLFVQTICVSESKRLKGLGTKVLSYIEKYAIENGHDLIFGHITQKAKFTKDKRETFFCDIDMIKNWLHSNGYAINNENNDFYKVIQSNKLEGGGSVLLAPNGKPSKLTPEQWHLVRTPEFKAWFGDWEALENAKIRDRGMDEITLNQLAKNVSKVVDENGEPMVCFHGSDEKFDTFKYGEFGFHFGGKKAARERGKLVKPYFLSVKKKLWFDYDLGDWNDLEMWKEYLWVFEEDEDKYKDFVFALNNSKNIEQFKNKIVKIYDGIKYFNAIEGDFDEYSYMVFNPKNIKLADGSNTTFDGNNPDIRFESGGEIAEIEGTYSSLRNFIEFNPSYSKKIVELYGIKESEVEDSLDGELGYDEEILIALVGNNYRVFYDEDSDEFEITKKKKKVEGSAVIVLANNKNKNEIFRVINEEINTEFEPRFAVLYDSKIVGGSTFFIQDEIYFFDISISEKARGLGIGKELIDKIIEDAKKMGCQKLSAEVVNPKLLAYLRKIGFSIYKSQDQNYAELDLSNNPDIRFESGGRLNLI